ncbi:Protein of uncharacterised function (DUF3558) [Nocardia africana]|uniref:Protein of uncharacterized function (DUF3558) n=1 Tax=Nocardia africana TaxID=134964 RepID=A0A378WLC7_9NOCA|nr:Protein of uncharacterised function (DUF3558) [Nocardia africana]
MATPGRFRRVVAGSAISRTLVGVRWVAAVITVAIAVLVAGCGASGPSPVATSSAPAPAAAQALAVGECGSAADADIVAATGVSGLQRVSANPLRCRWEAAGGASVTFEWFRASPIAAHTATDPAAHAEPLRIGDHTGRLFSTPQWCEAAVDSGAADFVDWRADEPQPTAAQACSAVRQLAAVTLAKAG